MNKITSGTIARTIVLVLALLNQILAIAGKGTIDIADDTIYQLCTLGATVITALIAWWKNNDITKNARDNKEIVKDIKKGNILLAKGDDSNGNL